MDGGRALVSGVEGEGTWGRLTLWGGGVNAQGTLLLGTVEEVADEAHAVTRVLNQDGGFVFCNIHNILAEVPPEKIIAMYRAAEA